MKTLFAPSSRSELTSRLALLRPDSAALWGKFDCPRMLAHIADGLRLTLGEISPKPKKTLLRHSPFKQLVIYWIPFPKGAPTAPELVSRAPRSCENEIADVNQLMETIVAKPADEAFSDHPLFGRLTRKEWGVLIYRHIDHHLRQFGV